MLRVCACVRVACVVCLHWEDAGLCVQPAVTSQPGGAPQPSAPPQPPAPDSPPPTPPPKKPPRGEYHANNQTMAKLLHKSIGLGAGSAADPDTYQAYQQHFEEVGAP